MIGSVTPNPTITTAGIARAAPPYFMSPQYLNNATNPIPLPVFNDFSALRPNNNYWPTLVQPPLDIAEQSEITSQLWFLTRMFIIVLLPPPVLIAFNITVEFEEN